MAHKLLLADDSITIQKVVELVLAEEDFEIKAVSNGEDALNVIESFNPDIVLADIEMPKVNGYQLCDKIKKNRLTAHIPVILLAGAFEPIDEELSQSIGADDSVIKPFESQELISKINAVLTMSSAVSVDETEVAAEEVFDIAEESAEAVEVGEPVGLAEAEEDLWSMEEMPETVQDAGVEALLAEETGLEETFEIAEEAPAFEAPEPVAPVVTAAPARTMREAVMPEIEVPSKAEMMAGFEATVKESVNAFLSSIDIKDAVLSALAPAMKDSAEKVLWEIAPELADKMMKEVLKGSLASLTAAVEKVIWETVPDLASTMISKEIEKIKSEF